VSALYIKIMNIHTINLLWISVLLLTNELTDSMEQGPFSEAYSCSARQEISCLLWNLKVHYCLHKILPLDPVLSQMNPVQTIPPYFLKIHFNTLSVLRSSECAVFIRLSNQNFVHFSCLPYTYILVPHSSHPWFDHFNNIWWRVQITDIIIM
jgi:hypothetical protein